MKKIIRCLVMGLLGGIFLGTGLVLSLTQYYRNRFPVNTWINGMYCTGKTVVQVNEELASAQEASVIHIVDAEGMDWIIPMEDAEIRPDYTDALWEYVNRQDSFSWLDHLQMPVSDHLTIAKYIANEEKLRSCFEALPFVAREQEKGTGVTVYCGQAGYCFQDGNTQRLNKEKAYAYLQASLSHGRTSVDLLEAGCYEDIPDSDIDKGQRELWAQIVDYMNQSSHIAYDMGAELIYLDWDIISQFLKKEPESNCPILDHLGRLAIDEDSVRSWVEQLAMAYDTCGTERAFIATRGDVVKVKYGTYGTKLDVDAETTYLLEALKMGGSETQVHVPTYVQQGYVRGLDDIGGTYIEIDMTEQRMYYYVEGELTLETDVVTGNIGTRRGTPEGIYYVYAKERNRILRGSDYASFVKYWMPVKGGVGIHDASWRSAFGGTIYKTDGSHGCINTPTNVMTQLYDMAEIGTPVIMFY